MSKEMRWVGTFGFGTSGGACGTKCPACGSHSAGMRYFRKSAARTEYANRHPVVNVNHRKRTADFAPGWEYCPNGWHGPAGTISVMT